MRAEAWHSHRNLVPLRVVLDEGFSLPPAYLDTLIPCLCLGLDKLPLHVHRGRDHYDFFRVEHFHICLRKVLEPLIIPGVNMPLPNVEDRNGLPVHHALHRVLLVGPEEVEDEEGGGDGGGEALVEYLVRYPLTIELVHRRIGEEGGGFELERSVADDRDVGVFDEVEVAVLEVKRLHRVRVKRLLRRNRDDSFYYTVDLPRALLVLENLHNVGMGLLRLADNIGPVLPGEHDQEGDAEQVDHVRRGLA